MVVLRGDHFIKFNLMEKNKSKGLGDTVEKITKATGIKSIVDAVNKARGIKDCGCNGRKEALNKKFPYKK
tara:strand:+ start:52 stop:261 length:210 start_codon:yes stop_codon:yes gene_type:complete